jgi:hypothetical protein
MAFDPLTAILNIANTVLDRVIPDKTQAAAAKASLLETTVKGEWDNAIAQLQVDQAEAANQSVFVAGWRPWIGWVCGMAFAYTYVVQPLFSFFAALFGHPVNLPPVNLDGMMPVLLGMLGLGAMRSWDKSNGKANGS